MQVGKKVSTIKHRTSSQKKTERQKVWKTGSQNDWKLNEGSDFADFKNLLTDFLTSRLSDLPCPSLSIQTSVLYRFGEVFCLDIFAGRKISDSS